MKRVGFLFEKIIDMENLKLAHKNARKGKAHYKEVKWVNKNEEYALNKIQSSFINGTYKTSEYTLKTLTDKGKKRTIAKLPYYPDRIVHHAILQIVEPIFTGSLIRDTFQSIKGRGTHDARKRITKFIEKNQPTHCMKIDLKKYYPNIDHEILKKQINRKIKDQKVLDLLFEIIDSYKKIGLPIGNYTSQILGNLYLSWFDWRMKKLLKGYFRYCDDMLFFGSKEKLEDIKLQILSLDIGLKYHPTVELFRSIQFIGYRYTSNKLLVRKNILRNIQKATIKNIWSFWGWFKPIRNKMTWKDTYRRIHDYQFQG